MKHRTKILCLALAVLVGGFVGCGERGKPGVIKIVSSLPRTGSAKKQSDTMVNAIRMAIDEAGGKVGEFTIEYEDLDDATASAGKWTAEAESANADLAVQNPDVMVYIGTLNSGAAKVSMPKTNQGRLLMVSPANTATSLTKPGTGAPGEPGIYRPTGKLNFCRMIPADDVQGPLSADFAKSQGVKRVYVLDDNEVYGKGIAELFKSRCEEIGIEVLGHESIDANAQEFKSLMTKIKSHNPDLVYFGGTTQSKGAQVAKDMVAVGLNAKIMVPDGCYEQVLIESAGAENLNDRCYVTFGGLPPDQLTGAGKQFVDKYKAKYGNMPEAYATYAYEATKVALDAIARAGKKDREAITQAGLATRDFDKGALPKWSFDENGDTTLRTMSVNIVRDGKFEFLQKMGE